MFVVVALFDWPERIPVAFDVRDRLFGLRSDKKVLLTLSAEVNREAALGREPEQVAKPPGRYVGQFQHEHENPLPAPVVQSFARHISVNASRNIQCGSRKLSANGGDCLYQVTLPKASFIRAIHR